MIYILYFLNGPALVSGSSSYRYAGPAAPTHKRRVGGDKLLVFAAACERFFAISWYPEQCIVVLYSEGATGSIERRRFLLETFKKMHKLLYIYANIIIMLAKVG